MIEIFFVKVGRSW